MSLKISIALKCVLIFLCSLSIISSLCSPQYEDYKHNHGYTNEQYEPSFFSKFQNIHDIISDADNHFAPSERTSLAYFEYVADVVRKRFYHGYSYYSLSENPISYISGLFTGGQLSAIVIPDDIMKHPMAACSQQAIVLMDIFKRKGINFRKVAFLHHFTSEAMIEGQWRYFDTDMEPDLKNIREPLTSLLSTGKFYQAYAAVGLNMVNLHKILGDPKYGKTNAAPAPHAGLFHKLSFFLNSKYFLLFSLLLMILSTTSLSKVNIRLLPAKRINILDLSPKATEMI